LLIAALLNVDACPDDNAEARRVNAHLRAARTHANSIADNFWADRSKAEKLTVLQDRNTQAGALAETCHVALAIFHQAMFPLNYQPDSLTAFVEKIREWGGHLPLCP
jgi:hypothetical protein